MSILLGLTPLWNTVSRYHITLMLCNMNRIYYGYTLLQNYYTNETIMIQFALFKTQCGTSLRPWAIGNNTKPHRIGRYSQGLRHGPQSGTDHLSRNPRERVKRDYVKSPMVRTGKLQGIIYYVNPCLRVRYVNLKLLCP